MKSKHAIILLGLLLIITVVVVIAALAYLLPLAQKLLGLADRNGIAGLSDVVAKLLTNVWSGAGK